MEIYFTRHGESTMNADNKVAGTYDCELTQKGVRQAQNAAKKISSLDITHVISSPLKRALQTAEILSKDIPSDIQQWNNLHEVGYGDCQNKTRPSNCRTNLEMISMNICHGAESLQDIEVRAKSIIKKLKQLPPDARVLVVGHGTFTSIIFAVLDGVPPDGFLDYRLNWTYENSEIKKILL